MITDGCAVMRMPGSAEERHYWRPSCGWKPLIHHSAPGHVGTILQRHRLEGRPYQRVFLHQRKKENNKNRTNRRSKVLGPYRASQPKYEKKQKLSGQWRTPPCIRAWCLSCQRRGNMTVGDRHYVHCNLGSLACLDLIAQGFRRTHKYMLFSTGGYPDE